jgi:hypothetical protein
MDMGRKLVASLGAVALMVVAFAVLPSSSSAEKPAGNCVVESNGDASAEGVDGMVVFCQALDITKEVTGEAGGRTFPITVDCQRADTGTATAEVAELPTADFPPFGPKTVNLQDGETVRLLAAGPVDCTITEDPPEGCTLVSIDPDTVHTSNPNDRASAEVNGDVPPLIVHTVTVINDCPAEVLPAEDAPAEAAPAGVVRAQPAFTG